MKRLFTIFFIFFLIFSMVSCGTQTKNDNLVPITRENSGRPISTVTQPVSPTQTQTSTSLVTTMSATTPVPGTTAPTVTTSSSTSETVSELSYFNTDYYERYKDYKKRNPEMDYEQLILYVNIGLDNPFYTNVKTVTDTGSLTMLVNKYHKLPSDFVPELVELPQSLCSPGVGKQYLQKEALKAFKKMHLDAKESGLSITAYGTYRSIDLQDQIWQRAVNSGRTVEDVDSLNARGGHSEHNTGLAVDVIGNDYFVEKTKEYQWYKDNCHKYGFIIRYPEGMDHITGYAYEPWHLRYLGEDLAGLVYESGLTYEEYYELYIASKNK